MKRHKRNEVLVSWACLVMCSGTGLQPPCPADTDSSPQQSSEGQLFYWLGTLSGMQWLVLCANPFSQFPVFVGYFCPVVRRCVHVSQICSLNSLWKRIYLPSLSPSLLPLSSKVEIILYLSHVGRASFVHVTIRRILILTFKGFKFVFSVQARC